MKLPFGKKTAAAGTAAYGANKHHEHNEGQKDLGKPATKKGRTLLLLATLLGLTCWLILLVGTALLTKRTHSNRFARNSSQVDSYQDAFQSSHYTPYPDSASRQWMMLWWIIVGSLFTWLLTILLALRAARIVQWRPALVGLHVYFLVLCTFVIDALLLFVHRGYHRRFFGRKRMDVALAGLFGLAIAHGLAILALGLLANKLHLDNRHINTGIRERVVEKQVEVPVQQHSSHREEPRMEQSRMQESAPVRVHAGDTRVTEPYANTTGRAAPVQVHQGGIVPQAGARELGTSRY